MPKNPFVNCKSRKRRKIRVMVQKPATKLFCPRTMVRYDNAPNEYGTVFVCKMCFTCVLSENAVRAHVLRCNDTNKKIIIPDKKDDDARYICEYCNRIFSRKVALKKHKEQHNKTSDVESEEEFVDSLPHKLMKTLNGERVVVKNNVGQQDAAVEDVIVEHCANKDIVNEFGAQDDEVMDEQIEYNDDIVSNEANLVIEKAAAEALKNVSAAAAAVIRHVTANMQNEIDVEVAAYAYGETAESKEAVEKKIAVDNEKVVAEAMFQ